MEILQTETQKMIEKEKKDDDVAVIILLYKNPNFRNIFRPYDLPLYGKKLYEWIELACCDYEIKTTICTPENDILALIKPMLTDKKYTLVLFSDTPLIKKNTIKDIITFAKARTIGVLNLIRGYVFDTEYVKNTDSIKSTLIEKFDEEDFVDVSDLKKLEIAGQIMKQRIMDFHLSKGVVIQDETTTFIDAGFIIESGVIIEPNNIIKGKGYIGKNTIIENGNTIIDSVIMENCIVKTSYIFSSKIKQNTVVGPFEKVIYRKF